MDQTSTVAPLQIGPDYPAPPRGHWAALLIGSIVSSALFERILGASAAEFAITLISGAWIIYLCLWIRKLDPRSRSILWAPASIGVQFALDGLDLLQDPSLSLTWAIGGLWIGSLALDFVVIFAIRNELQKHYNEREPIGLHLGGVMTFFFSYLYFQYHLYEIAQFKKRQTEGVLTAAGRTLFP